MPPTRPQTPRYPYPVQLLLLPALRILLGIQSSPSRDAARLLKSVSPPPRVLNADKIPSDSPFVLVINHYDHPKLGAWWGAAVVLCAVATRRAREPYDIHMMMTREWWYSSGFGRAVKQPLTRWFFGQLAKAYGLILLLPVVDEYRGQGALYVRRALEYTRGDHPHLVGLAPEGRTGFNLSLCEPPPGVGLFLLLLTYNTILCLPMGIFEDESSILTINVGVPFNLNVPLSYTREERDRIAVRQTMVEIGKLLPERMWGVYQKQIQETFTIKYPSIPSV